MKKVATFIYILFCLLAMQANAQNWEETDQVLAQPYLSNAGDNFGNSIDIDGSYAVIGSSKYQKGKGCGYVLFNDGSSWSIVAKLTNSNNSATDQLGYDVSIDGDIVVASAMSSGDYVLVFEKPAGGWADMTETVKLSGGGSSVSVEGTTIVVGNVRANAHSGEAIIFENPGTGWAQLGILTASDASSSDYFGTSVSISGDVVAVGTKLSVAAYVYEKPVGGWSSMTQTARLTTNDAVGLSGSVSIAGDVIVAGAYWDSGQMGAAYIYEKPGSNWINMVQTAKLTPDDGVPQDYFGYSVSINGDAILVGAFANSNFGASYLFEKPGSNWVNMSLQTAKLTASDGDEDRFGRSVAIYGEKVIIGAYFDDNQGLESGSAYAYDKPGTGWAAMTEDQKIQPIPYLATHLDKFGASVAVDGNYAVIGSPGYKSNQGCAYVLFFDGFDWQTQARLTDSYGKANDQFGKSVDISGDVIVVGSPYSNLDGLAPDNSGEAFVFVKPGAAWVDATESSRLQSSDVEDDNFGWSVSISGDDIVVGAPNSDPGYGDNSGLAHIFEKPVTGWDDLGIINKDAVIYANVGAVNDHFGYSVSISGDVIVVGAINADSKGAVYVYVKPGGGWVYHPEDAKLTASDGATGVQLGYSVDIYDGLVVSGANHDDDNGYQSGSAYLFEKPVSGWVNSTQTSKIIASDGSSGNLFGASVAVSTNYIAVGSNFMNVYTFEQSASSWSSPVQTSKLSKADFGSYYDGSVSLFNETLLAGALGYYGSDGSGAAFFYHHFTKPSVQATTILTNNISKNTININWTDGDGQSRVVFMKKDGTGEPTPVDNTTYTANTTYGSGSQVDGWYCIFNGDGHASGITVNNLLPETLYRIMVLEYNGPVGSELYLPGTASVNPFNHTTWMNLDDVGYNVAGKQLTNTSTNLNYNTDGNWYGCNNGTTDNVNFVEGPVMVRESINPGNIRTIATLVKPNAPTVTIDYLNEQTNEVLSNSIEYNYDNNFTTSNSSGAGTKLDLTPGQDVYLRYKATTGELASQVLSLVVTDRPVAPAFTLDYENESTTELVDITIEYAENVDFTQNVITGSGSVVMVVPETDLWFRMKASNVNYNFSGTAYFLDVPSRPAAPVYSIDYVLEQTNELIATDIEYAESPDYTQNLQVGTGSTIVIVPAQNIWYRKKASNINQKFAGESFELVVPPRPVATSISIDYEAEMTVEDIPLSMEYSESEDFTVNLQIGSGAKIPVTPGKNLWFRTAASNTNENFRGYAQSLVVPSRPVAPIIGIDYYNEKTNDYAYPSMEYAESADYLVNHHIGTPNLVSLEPGTDLWFRVRASNANHTFYGESLELDVPERPAMPAYTIDYIDETTTEVVPTSVEYSSYSDFSANSNGSGLALGLNPGENLWFRVKPTGSSFRSDAFSLVVPPRPAAPAYTINFQSEVTNEQVPNSVEYAEDNSYSLNLLVGNGQNIALSPGTELWFRIKAVQNTSFSSISFFLDVPDRPNGPTVRINYYDEQTYDPVSSSMEYAEDATFTTNVKVGDGSILKITPGTDLWFRIMATDQNFEGESLMLSIPERPDAPVFTIDYENEVTFETVGSDVEYADDADFTVSHNYGFGSVISVVPGIPRWFRLSASDGQKRFKSDVFKLEAPARPAADSYSIDFVNEVSSEIIAQVVEYAEDAGFNYNLMYGEDTQIIVHPGTNLWFRHRASNELQNFRGESFQLTVPERPAAPAFPVVDDINDTFGWGNQVMPTDNYKYSLDGGSSWNVCDKNPISVGDVDIPSGSVMVYVFASNVVGNERFESDILYSDMAFTVHQVTGILDFADIRVRVYPNPATNTLNLEVGENTFKAMSIMLMDLNGNILQKKIIRGNQIAIDVSGLSPAPYFLKVVDEQHMILKTIHIIKR